jgi:hypothetical protein
MPVDVFSTYSMGENRVTASIMAVLRSLSLHRIERLLGALLEQLEFELVLFENQPGKGGAGVPDALIVSSCRILLEAKLKKNQVNLDQLKRHLKKLQETHAKETFRALLVLTPDDHRPAAFDEIKDPMLVWSTYSALDQAIEELLDDRQEVVSEREAFLLRELQSLLLREKLLTSESDVVVVAARNAWPEYKEYHAYVCQPDRPFQAVQRIAFYTNQKICPLVPRILEVHNHVKFVPGLGGKLGELVDKLLAEDIPLDTLRRMPGTPHKVFLLSPPGSTETIDLGREIVNDLKTKNGRSVAFTQGQRYVSIERLQQARTTTEVIANE